MAASREIVIHGAAQHNLKNIDLALPKERLIVFCGVSGSGKSSLAFDTIFAEGQRRYVESLSAYARQFLGQIERPRFESITGLAPTVAIQQRTASSNPRSTVGTVTEILDYLRILYARMGDQRCHQCGSEVGKQTAQEMVRHLLALEEGTDLTLMGPLVVHRKGEHRDLFTDLLGRGFARFLVDGTIQKLRGPPELDKNVWHDISVVVDRIRVRPDIESRLTDSVETCLKVSGGKMNVRMGTEDRSFSEDLYCDRCRISLPELSPQLFSFNTPQGACTACNGLGTRFAVDPERVVPDPKRSVNQGAIALWQSWRTAGDSWTREVVGHLASGVGMDLTLPWDEMPADHRHVLLYGNQDGPGARGRVPWYETASELRWEGISNTIMRRFHETQSDSMRSFYQSFFSTKHCDECDGTRLRPEARAVTIAGRDITEISRLTVEDLLPILEGVPREGHRTEIARVPLRESLNRLRFLENVGLGYVTLDRSTESLSGGESQRIRLASQLGTELTGVIYVLDEPSIGLHPRDNSRLVETLKHLRDIGNTVLVVEHDRDTIDAADHVVDFGPGAGVEGGEIVYSGDVQGLYTDEASLTGGYLSGRLSVPIPDTRRAPKGWLHLEGATHNNLRDIDVHFPLGVFCVVTGVSGAGKSSLVDESLRPALLRHFHSSSTAEPGRYRALRGLELIDKVVSIDQRPIGRTPRSNPATYTKVWDLIRKVFAETREAKTYGFGPGRFSFNVKGGRCERCQGAGVLKVEMHFLPDVYVTCPECVGGRFNDATLRVRYRDHSIADVLRMPIASAVELFEPFRGIRQILQTLVDVGLGYVRLGQPSPTLSGGEAQRIKLSRELARRDTGSTLYLLDEPTTGLHFEDISRLLGVVQRLVKKGNTVLVVEHNLEVIRAADHVIDLGPEGGRGGGEVIAVGTPEEIAATPESYTGRYLRTKVPELSGRRTTA
ncbi:MAG: excinuclease ABC subunit UvrA [Pseudomonadota bacterium]